MFKCFHCHPAHTDQKECFGGTLVEHKKAWREPTDEAMKQNAAHMQRMLRGPAPCSLGSALDVAADDNNNGDNN